MTTKKAPAMRVRDMTVGDPIRLILAFAIPLFIGNIFQQFYNMADTMVVGYTLGDSAISAIGATSSLYSLLINLASGLNTGYGIIVTQRFGAKDERGLRQSIAGMILLDIAAVALLTILSAQNWGAGRYDRIRSTLKKVLGLVFLWSIFGCTVVYLFGSGIIRLTTGTEDPEIIRNAVMSMRIHLPFYPMVGTLFCLRHSLQSMGQKTIPILSSCIELVIKILSAAFLIPVLGYLGTCVTEPAAWTVMAAFLTAYYLTRRKKIFPDLA